MVSARNLFFVLVLVGVAVFAMHITAPDRSQLTPLETRVKDTLAPVQEKLVFAGKWVRTWVSFPFEMVHLARENKELKESVDRLNGQIRQMREYELENQRLKELLDYQTNNNLQGHTVVASVIGRDPGNWFGTITLNKGLKDRVRVGSSVLVASGLVGRVAAVSNNTAEVILITDPRSGVGCILQKSRTPGILEGVVSGSNLVRMIHIPVAQEVKVGEVVITSGIGSLFPKGIPIGRVENISKEPSGLFKTAVVKPYVDLTRLEEVLILTGNWEPPDSTPGE